MVSQCLSGGILLRVTGQRILLVGGILASAAVFLLLALMTLGSQSGVPECSATFVDKSMGGIDVTCKGNAAIVYTAHWTLSDRVVTSEWFYGGDGVCRQYTPRTMEMSEFARRTTVVDQSLNPLEITPPVEATFSGSADASCDEVGSRVRAMILEDAADTTAELLTRILD